jgi:hypothetical protein
MKKFMPISSAFILALALPALAAETRGNTIAPTDEKTAEADTFMNAKLIAIQRDSIQIRDNDGRKKTLALEKDAAIEHSAKPGTDVILAIKEMDGEESRVTAVKRSIGGSSSSSALMNTRPVYIPAPARDSALARSTIADEAARQAAAINGMVDVPMGGDGTVASGETLVANPNFVGVVPSLTAEQLAAASPDGTLPPGTIVTGAGRVPVLRDSALQRVPRTTASATGTGRSLGGNPLAGTNTSSTTPGASGVVPPPPPTVPNFTNANLAGASAGTGSARIAGTNGSGSGNRVASTGVVPGVVPGGIFVGAPFETDTAGTTSTTIGSTQQRSGTSTGEGSLGADAAAMPMAQAVQMYQAAVARAASRVGEVDRAFGRYKDLCVGPQSTISSAGDRTWSDVWDGTGTPAETRSQCQPLLAQALRIGHEVQDSLSGAEDAARRAGVLPGVMRQIRTMYGMDWGGWDR